MNRIAESYEKTLDRILLEAAHERDPEKRKRLRLRMIQLKAEHNGPSKSAIAKDWWPATCRGIVG
jgi:hypothetical protein